MINTRNLRVIMSALVLLSITSYVVFPSRKFAEFEAKVPTQFESGEWGGSSDQLPNAAGFMPDQPTAEPLSGNTANIDHTGADDTDNEQPKPGSWGSNKSFAANNHGSEDNENSLLSDTRVDTRTGNGWKVPLAGQMEEHDLLSRPASMRSSADKGCQKTDYVVMIDAGSTGSRVHVYAFDTCVSPPALLREEFNMLKPGLSSFDTDTVGAAKSLDPLLNFALENVPKDKQSCTPVAVKATAGLRLLGKTKSDEILKGVRLHLEENYPFAVVEGDGVSIMDGSEEGVFAWITTNYLLGNIGGAEKTETAAVFDLGGGSTQIVFEPQMGDLGKMADGDHVYNLIFGGRQLTLYQFSHLGYGLMQARNKINLLVVESALKDGQNLTKLTAKFETEDAKAEHTINNPCMPPGVIASDVVCELAEDEFYVVNFKGPSEAAGAQCRYLAEKVLNLDKECTTKPCSFNGVYQPSLSKAFHQNSEMWLFSYFYDRTNPLGFPKSFTVEELKDLTKHVCAGETMWQDILLGDSVKALQEEPHWCLDLSFITAMLHTGYNIPLHRELRTAMTIANNQLGWCLGASLPLLDPMEGGWKCRVKEVSPEAEF